jgi:hypothetical protein
MFTPDGRHSPLGPASVAFSGQYSLDDDSDVYRITVAGARADRYRYLPVGSIAGLSAILSPDGRRLAVENGVVDLTTGIVARLPHSDGGVRHPEAWSPDGRYLATADYAYSGGAVPRVTRATLSVVDTSTGRSTVLGEVADPNVFDGWLAAFSPNDDLAYQLGTSIHITGPTGNPIRTFTVPDGVRIAGKGAWTASGQQLAVVSEGRCGCGRRWDARWTVSTVAVATGTRAGASYVVDGVIAVRMLGWAGGRPVVQTFEPGPHGPGEPGDRIVDFRQRDPADNDGYDYMNEVENLDEVHGSRVVLLALDGAHRTLVSTGDQVESIDTADFVVSSLADEAAVRNGYPPLLTEAHVAQAGGVVVLGAIVAGIAAIVRRAVRRRRTPLPVAVSSRGPNATA